MSNLKNMVQMNLSIKQNFLKYKSSRAILQFSGFPPPLFFFFNIYLAVPDFSCDTQDL